jgi:monothiol glutaredoxin
MPHCAAGWAASFMPLHYRPRHPNNQGSRIIDEKEFHIMTDTVASRIQGDIENNDVMLYMKGTPMFPQCGFSARVIQILTHMGVPFQSANVLEDDELREGVKSFSQWPTIPQLYVKGEFVGGCDIVTEMFQSGELETLMKEQGVPAKA